jgi:dipeptidyl aminopeptidase/acylaminoacyl peptidase
MLKRLNLSRVFLSAVISTILISCASTSSYLGSSLKGKKPLDLEGIHKWQIVYAGRATPDGLWALYNLNDSPFKPRDSESDSSDSDDKSQPKVVVIKSTQTDKSYEYTSSDDIWVSFSQNSQWATIRRVIESDESNDEDSDTDDSGMNDSGMSDSGMGDSNEEPDEELILLNLASGEEKVFESAGNFGFAGDWLIIGRKSGEATSLSLYHMLEKRYKHLGLASSYRVNNAGDYLVWTISQPSGYANGVFLRNNQTGKVVTLDQDDAQYSNLSWTPEGDALLIIKSIKQQQKDEQGEEKEVTKKRVMAVANIGKGNPQITFVDQNTNGFPKGLELDENNAPAWMGGGSSVSWLKDRSGLNLTLRKIKAEDEDSSNDDSMGGMPMGMDMGGGDMEEVDPNVPNVAIWHWNQAEYPSRESNDGEAKERKYPAVYWFKNNRVVQLLKEEDAETIYINPSALKQIKGSHDYVMALDKGEPLEDIIDGTYAGYLARDAYLINLSNGTKRKVLNHVDYASGLLSTKGDYFAYYHNEHIHLYQVSSGKEFNLTKNLPVSFVGNVDYPHPISAEAVIWTKNNDLILGDNWDLWSVPFNNGQPGTPINLTVNGTKDKIDYALLEFSELGRGDNLEVDPSALPLYVSATEKRTKRTGYGRISLDKPGVEWLVDLDDVKLDGVVAVLGGASPIAISKDKNKFFYEKSTYKSKTFYVADKDFKNEKAMYVDAIDSTPLRRQYSWSDGVKMVNYRCSWGDEVEGALFLPANYKKGQKYPTVTAIYDTDQSVKLNDFALPGLDGYDWPTLTSRGYAVFLADIRFQLENPGKSGFECLMPAIDAAIETGVVDPDRIGLHGHSWGGYQSAFYITQTDRFKGVIAGAALTDLISMYGSAYYYGEEPIPNHTLIEGSQGRMVKTIWEAWPTYLDNSPLYHAPKVKTPLLLLHNDKDDAVDFTQGVAYFNALRRLRKEVVMLQYRGENHSVSGRTNSIDYRQRQIEFWDHFLKGKPAPDWWSEGVKQEDMNEHLEKRGTDDIVPNKSDA